MLSLQERWKGWNLGMQQMIKNLLSRKGALFCPCSDIITTYFPIWRQNCLYTHMCSLEKCLFFCMYILDWKSFAFDFSLCSWVFGFLRKKIFWINHSLSAVFIQCCLCWARWKVRCWGVLFSILRNVGYCSWEESSVFEMPQKWGGRMLSPNKRTLQCITHFIREFVLCVNSSLMYSNECSVKIVYILGHQK